MDATLLAILLFVAIAMIVAAVLMLVRDVALRNRLAFEQRLSDGETEVNLERMPTLEAPEGRGPIRAIDRFF